MHVAKGNNSETGGEIFENLMLIRSMYDFSLRNFQNSQNEKTPEETKKILAGLREQAKNYSVYFSQAEDLNLPLDDFPRELNCLYVKNEK